MRKVSEEKNVAGKNPRLTSSRERIQRLQEEVKQAEVRNKHLVARIALVEANAVRLGIDPEELYRPMMKPVRAVSHAGKPGAKRTTYASKRR